MAATVAEAGYDLIETASLSEALDHVRRIVPDVVLLPVTARGSSLERIRDDERWDSVPAIVLTPADDPAAMFEAFERGADDVVPYAAQSGELAAGSAPGSIAGRSRGPNCCATVTGALTEESFALLLRRESEQRDC